MKRCPQCGEKYSDTYKRCPFCEEEDALRDGGRVHRSSRRSTSRSRQPNLLTPTLVVLIVIMAALLLYLLFGDRFASPKPQEETNPPASQGQVVTPQQPEVGGEETPGQMPEDPVEDPEKPEDPAETGALDYDRAMKLPAGLTLSTTDFTLRELGESHTISVYGGSGTYQWFSEDDGVASVDANGKVTAVSGGNVNVVVTDGSKQGTCIVRVTAAAAPSTGTSTGTSSGTSTGTSSGTSTGTSTGGALRAGPAVVINGGNGVNVRSGPGTDYDALASVSNGASVEIVESVGNDWYKITFVNVGGVSTPGYMKGEFLKNQ